MLCSRGVKKDITGETAELCSADGDKLLNPVTKLSGKRTVHNDSGKKAWPHRRSKSLR